jgi:hypothetical protein
VLSPRPLRCFLPISVTGIIPGKNWLDIQRGSAYLFTRFSVEVPEFDQDNDFKEIDRSLKPELEPTPATA